MVLFPRSSEASLDRLIKKIIKIKIKRFLSSKYIWKKHIHDEVFILFLFSIPIWKITYLNHSPLKLMNVFILTTSESQSPMPFKVYLNSEFYLQSTIITPFPIFHFNIEVLLSRWQTLTILWYIKFCQLIMPLSFLSKLSCHAEMPWIQSLIFMHLDKKISKLHIIMKSLLRHSTQQLSNRKQYFLRNSRSLQKIFSSMKRIYFSSWIIGKIQTFLESILCPSVSQGKVASSF